MAGVGCELKSFRFVSIVHDAFRLESRKAAASSWRAIKQATLSPLIVFRDALLWVLPSS